MAAWRHLLLGPGVTALAATAKTLKMEFLLFGRVSWPVGALLFSETLFVYVLDHWRDHRKGRRDAGAATSAPAPAPLHPAHATLPEPQRDAPLTAASASATRTSPHRTVPEHARHHAPATDVLSRTGHGGGDHHDTPREPLPDANSRPIARSGDGDGAQSHAHLLEGGGGGGSGRGTRTPPARHATGWVERVAYALLLLSLGGMAVSVARLPWQASVVLTATIAVGVLWSVPVLPGCATDPAGARTVRLRKFKDVPLLKGPLLSVVLTVSLAGVPIAAHLYAGSGDRDFRVTPPFRSVWTVVLMEYLFLLTNAVLYDVRDVVEDGRNGVPTWPVRLGVRPTCVTLAVVNLLMGVVWMAVEANWLALVSALILAAFAAMARPTRPTLYYIALVIYWAADARRNPFS